MPLRHRLAAPGSLWRIAIAAIGIAILAFAGWHAALRGLADWRAARWRHEVRVWTGGSAITTEAQWQRTLDGLRDALRLDPRNPDIWEYLGLLYDIGSRRFFTAGASNVYTEFSLIHYRGAAQLRPTSPYAWAGVALEKYRLGQLDGEFSHALASAMRLGPWEPDVQLIASDLGMVLWDRLEPAFRDLIRENWRRTALRQADALARIAVAHRVLALLCQESLDAMKNQLKCGQALSPPAKRNTGKRRGGR